MHDQQNIKFKNRVFTLYVAVLGQGTTHTNVTASLLLQVTLLVEATVSCRLVIPLLNIAFRQSVPSQILFSITYSFAPSH